MEQPTSLTFDIYGKMLLQIERSDGFWAVYRLRDGRRSPFHDISIPPDMPAAAIETFLDDMFHESSGPGQRIRRI